MSNALLSRAVLFVIGWPVLNVPLLDILAGFFGRRGFLVKWTQGRDEASSLRRSDGRFGVGAGRQRRRTGRRVDVVVEQRCVGGAVTGRLAGAEIFVLLLLVRQVVVALQLEDEQHDEDDGDQRSGHDTDDHGRVLGRLRANPVAGSLGPLCLNTTTIDQPCSHWIRYDALKASELVHESIRQSRSRAKRRDGTLLQAQTLNVRVGWLESSRRPSAYIAIDLHDPHHRIIAGSARQSSQ